MYPVITKHFSELSVREYHRIVQAREAVLLIHAPKESRFGAEDANLA